MESTLRLFGSKFKIDVRVTSGELPGSLFASIGGPPHGKAKRFPRTEPKDRGRGDDDPARARLRRHLELLGLTRTLDGLDERLAWAAHERPGATALLEYILVDASTGDATVVNRYSSEILPEP